MISIKTPLEIYNTFSKIHVIARDDAIIMAKNYHSQFGWISIEDDLPEDNARIFVKYEVLSMEGVKVGYGVSDFRNKRFTNEGDKMKISHWMLIPE